MTALQWALLIVGAAAVIAIWWASRRERRPSKRSTPSAGGPARPPSADQIEMFRSQGEFDEFGVGRPRKRSAPSAESPGESRPLFPGVDAGAASNPPPPGRGEPAFLKAEAASSAKPAGKKAVEEKIVTLLIAEREGTAIFGPKIHQALAQQGLAFGDKKIYHRMEQDTPVFSVASLIKPGHLDPAEQSGFSTPGLSMFLVLPGPRKPVAAVQDMIVTAKALAKSLNAEVFDERRQPFSDDSASALLADVQAWAQRSV